MSAIIVHMNADVSDSEYCYLLTASRRRTIMMESPSPSHPGHVVYMQPTIKEERKYIHSTTAVTVLGILVVIAASLIFILEILGILGGSIPFSTGIWTSLFFFVQGGFTISSGRNPTNKCVAITAIILSGVSALFAVILLSTAIINIVFAVDDNFWSHESVIFGR